MSGCLPGRIRGTFGLVTISDDPASTGGASWGQMVQFKGEDSALPLEEAVLGSLQAKWRAWGLRWSAIPPPHQLPPFPGSPPGCTAQSLQSHPRGRRAKVCMASSSERPGNLESAPRFVGQPRHAQTWAHIFRCPFPCLGPHCSQKHTHGVAHWPPTPVGQGDEGAETSTSQTQSAPGPAGPPGGPC